MTINVNIHEAKTQLSRLLERVAQGERVLISKAGTPVADLVPHVGRPVVFGGMRGERCSRRIGCYSISAATSSWMLKSEAQSDKLLGNRFAQVGLRSK